MRINDSLGMLYQYFYVTKPTENLLRRLLSHVFILFLAVLIQPVEDDDDEDEGMLDAGKHS